MAFSAAELEWFFRTDMVLEPVLKNGSLGKRVPGGARLGSKPVPGESTVIPFGLLVELGWIPFAYQSMTRKIPSA